MVIQSTELQSIWNLILSWSPKVAGGILVLLVGFFIANLAGRIFGKSLQQSKMDADLIPFLTSLISTLLKFLVILTAAGVVGIEITAFAALLAGAGLAVGAALSGTLGHFASGVMILIFKPYKVGDLVEIQGITGRVDEIQVFNTVINTDDNKRVIMPNGIATSGVMTNLSANGKLRVDLQVAMPYEEDFDTIKSIISGALQNVKDRLPDEPTIAISKFADSNVIIDVRPYATDNTYWAVYYESHKEIKKALKQAGIRVPYPIESEPPVDRGYVNIILRFSVP
jgi:small conductance mechanosensitive channel